MFTRRFKIGDIVHKMDFGRVSGEVTEVFDWGDVKVKWPNDTITYEDKRWLELEPKEKHTIVIEVAGGVVRNVMELPDGWDYEVVDYDDQQRYYCD